MLLYHMSPPHCTPLDSEWLLLEHQASLFDLSPVPGAICSSDGDEDFQKVCGFGVIHDGAGTYRRMAICDPYATQATDTGVGRVKQALIVLMDTLRYDTPPCSLEFDEVCLQAVGGHHLVENHHSPCVHAEVQE